MSSKTPHPIIFEDITGDSIRKAALRTRGAAGPSGQDADSWRKLLCGKRAYGLASDTLCASIATMAKKLCTERCENTETLFACRLVPLDKCPGLRPIGVGEVLRRIIGKSVMECTKEDVCTSTSALQMCAGKPAGSEAAVHAMKNMFEEEDTHGVILVDAANAFNAMNRKALLHNITVISPILAKFAHSNYQKTGNDYSSQEGKKYHQKKE